jgi:hypothetical protein
MIEKIENPSYKVKYEIISGKLTKKRKLYKFNDEFDLVEIATFSDAWVKIGYKGKFSNSLYCKAAQVFKLQVKCDSLKIAGIYAKTIAIEGYPLGFSIIVSKVVACSLIEMTFQR